MQLNYFAFKKSSDLTYFGRCVHKTCSFKFFNDFDKKKEYFIGDVLVSLHSPVSEHFFGAFGHNFSKIQ